MPRFFFNIGSGAEYLADEDGDECPTLQAAGTRAVVGAKELIAELRSVQRRPEETSFEITDERGRLALRIPFSVALRVPDGSARLHTTNEVFAMTTINTHEAPISPQLTDRALANFAFAIYHQLESGTRVSSVVADDHAGHRADPSRVNELIRHELARREADHIAFTERGSAVVEKVLATIRASASSLPVDAASAPADQRS